jgi:hypothetical protein
MKTPFETNSTRQIGVAKNSIAELRCAYVGLAKVRALKICTHEHRAAKISPIQIYTFVWICEIRLEELTIGKVRPNSNVRPPPSVPDPDAFH